MQGTVPQCEYGNGWQGVRVDSEFLQRFITAFHQHSHTQHKELLKASTPPHPTPVSLIQIDGSPRNLFAGSL